MFRTARAFGVLLPLLAASWLPAQQIDSSTIAALRWRNVGPANMAGRIADVEGIPWPSRTFFVAAAAGGVWKTTNAGTTFRAVFDTYGVASLGDLAIAPSDTNTLYLGTGEPNSRNSMSPGGGVFKSTDGGLTWKFVGLKETQHIGRIVVHPTNPNIAYVAALGHAWGPNKERGLYKTTDGGATWTLAKFISEKAGFVDVALDPRDPNVVWATSYERVRGPYFLNSGGPGSALWKSTDAGATWTEVKGGGFPETLKGRINIALAPSKPDVMYAMAEADTLPNAKKDPKVKAQKSPSGLYRSEDAGKTWTKTNDENTRPFYYNQVRVHPTNPNRVWFSSTPVKVSDEGGKNAKNATVGIHVDHHAMWIDPKDPSHHIVGDDGGISQSWDNGGSYDFVNTFAIGQFYNVSADNAVPYNVCGGAQDNGSWCGPSRRKQGPITNAMWFTFNGGDGFVTANDPTDPNIIYGESQGGNIGRYLVSTGERTSLVKPTWRPVFQQYEDSIIVQRGDTAQPASRDQQKRISDFKAAQKRDSIALDLRWNWNTPFFISKHNAQTLYFGANRVFKSTKRGDDMYPISADLSYADTMKIHVSAANTGSTGGITKDATGAETFGTIVSLNESPIRPGILYAGTDDGRLWASMNDGGSWTELTNAVKGVPAGTYVSRIEPSHFDSLTFYVTYDNHRRDDFTPYAFMTTDGGKSFKSIADGLPHGGADFVHVVREDLKDRNLLFAGTDVGAYVSGDAGKTWQKFMTNLPNVPVHDLLIHPRENELIAATHGRGFWIADITPLQQRTMAAGKDAWLYKPRNAHQWGEKPYNGESPGNKIFQAQSPQYGADIWYSLAKPAGGQVKVVIQDASGDTLRTLNGPGGAGIQRVSWDFRGKAAARPKLSPAGVRDSILSIKKTLAVLDTMETEGEVAKPILQRIRESVTDAGARDRMQQQMQAMFAGGGGGGGGGGSGGRGGPGGPGGADRWNERPAESNAPVRGGGEGAAAADANAAMGDMGAMSQVFQTLQRRLGDNAGAVLGFGGGGGGRRAGGGPAPLVNTGDYLVSITVGGQTFKQMLHVERTSGGDGTGAFFSGADDEEHDR